MSILSTLRRGLAPALRPSYRAAVIAVANGEEIDDETLAEVCASRGPGKFTEDVRLYQQRVEAAQKLAEVPALKAREAELKAEVVAHRIAVANAETMPAQRQAAAEQYAANAAYLAALSDRARQENEATQILRTTADPEIDRRIAECEGQISYHRASAVLTEAEEQQQAYAESEVAELPAMIEQANRIEAVELRARLMEAKGTLDSLRPRVAEVAAARREVKRLEREQQAIAAERLVPENFRLEG